MKVIALGSGPGMTEINNWNVENTKVVAFNNVWKGTDKWNYLIVAGDYPERNYCKRKLIRSFAKQGIEKKFYCHKGEMGIKETYLIADNKSPDSSEEEYLKSLVKLGVPGYFTISYWILTWLKPTHVAFLGFDMDYTPDESGSTAFYGKGYDIQTRGMPDYIYQMHQFYNGNPDYMIPLFDRLDENKKDCKFYNLSTNPKSKLPWSKISIENFLNL